jgi:hypothetical protein
MAVSAAKSQALIVARDLFAGQRPPQQIERFVGLFRLPANREFRAQKFEQLA